MDERYRKKVRNIDLNKCRCIGTAKEAFPQTTDPEDTTYVCHDCGHTGTGENFVFYETIDENFLHLQLCKLCYLFLLHRKTELKYKGM